MSNRNKPCQMATGIFAVLMSIFLSAAQAASGSDKVFDLPYIVEELDNGLKVVLVRTEYPGVVSMQIPVQTGSRNEVEEGKSGFAHFFEHMMFRGTEKYPQEVYGAILKNAGVDQNAYTTDDYTNYHITFTSEDLEKMIELEADRFRNLKYTEEQFRTEAQAVKGEYLKNYSNPVQKVFEVIRDMAFDTHPYKHTTMGFLRDIEQMPEQMEYSKEFFDRYYRPEKTAIIVVGDINPQRTLGWVNKYWGDWKQGDYVAEIPREGAPKGPEYRHIEWDAPTQPWLVMAFRSPAAVATEKPMPALDLLAEVYFSDTSALYQKLVIQERVVDQFFPYFPSRKDPGLVYIGARLLDSGKADYVREQIFRTLAEARTTLIDEARLEDLKSHMRYEFTNNLDNSEAIASMLASVVQIDRDPETINQMYTTYMSVTPEDIRQNANQFFTDQRRFMVTLSNDKSLKGFDSEASLDKLTGEAAKSGPGQAFAVVDMDGNSPIIDVSWLFHTGAAFEPEGKRGVAALTAAMISEGGSASRSYQDIQRLMFPMAGQFHAQVDKEMTVFRGRVHRDKLSEWYEIVSDQLLDPGWRENDFQRLKTRQINAIKTDLKGNNDEELAKEVLYGEIYGKHPYGSYNLGRLKDLESLTLDDVRSFHTNHYTQNNLLLGLSGDVPQAVEKTIKADLSALPVGTGLRQQIPAAPKLEGRHAVVVQKETSSVAVSFGHPIRLKRGDSDWPALWLVRSWLGEHRSSNSHLYERIRETRGMNYGDYAYIEYFPRGMFQFHPDANLARTEQIFQVWIRPLRSNNDALFATRTALYELDKLITEGMSEEDFEATRNFLRKFVGLLTSSQDRALGYALDSEYYGIQAFPEYIRSSLEKLTLEDVNRVIREHLQLDNLQFVFVSKNARELRDAIINNKASPLEYNTEKPEALLSEDKAIESRNFGIKAANIRVVPVEEVFE